MEYQDKYTLKSARGGSKRNNKKECQKNKKKVYNSRQVRRVEQKQADNVKGPIQSKKKVRNKNLTTIINLLKN